MINLGIGLWFMLDVGNRPVGHCGWSGYNHNNDNNFNNINNNNNRENNSLFFYYDHFCCSVSWLPRGPACAR